MTSLFKQILFVALAIVLLIMVTLGTISKIDITPKPKWMDCVVRSVWSADSLTLRIDGEKITARLAGVDAPDAGQPFFKQSSTFVRDSTKNVRCQWSRTGKCGSGCEYGILRFDGGALAGEELNRVVLSHGYGWWDSDTSYDNGLEDLEIEARRNGRGMWAAGDMKW